MTLTWLDWIFVAILALCVLMGMVRGLIREGLGLVVWIVALLVARAFCVQVGEFFHDSITNPVIRMVVGFVIVAFVVFILGGFCIKLLNALVSWVGMGSFNRLLGGVFGAIKGLVVLAVIGIVIPATPFANVPAWQQSVFRPSVTSLQGVLYQQYRQLEQAGGVSLPPQSGQEKTTIEQSKQDFSEQQQSLTTRFQTQGRPSSQAGSSAPVESIDTSSQQ